MHVRFRILGVPVYLRTLFFLVLVLLLFPVGFIAYAFCWGGILVGGFEWFGDFVSI